MDWSAFTLTLRLAVYTTGILFAVGLPVAYWLATSQWRGKVAVETIVALPLVLPPTVLGFYVLMAIGPNSPIGQWYGMLSGGERLPFSFPGILIGSLLFNLPFTVRPFTAALVGVDRRLVEASWCLGVGRLRTFFRVMFPLAWPGILTGIVLTFTHTIGEFGVVLMVGGNIPGVTRTISIAIYDDVQALNYETAGQTALGLVGFACVVLYVTYFLQRRVYGASSSV